LRFEVRRFRGLGEGQGGDERRVREKFWVGARWGDEAEDMQWGSGDAGREERQDREENIRMNSSSREASIR
jgi:hypothetical protein